GLISWWMVLPHWRGGLTWRDLCGRNHGTLTNMDPPTDWVGPRGRPGGWGALDFDGSNDHVLVAHSNSFNVSSLSVAAWVRASVGGSTRLIVNRDGSVRQFQFRVE